MGSVNISIRESVYRELRRRRGRGESFSDVLEKLLQQPGRLSDFAGAWSDMGASERREIEPARRQRQRVEETHARRRARADA
jgi:predicted CopG family antitoxin